MDNERFTLVDVFDNDLWMPGCPVEILSGALIIDSLIGQYCLQLSLANITDKRIVSVTVDITPYDAERKALFEEPLSVTYRDMSMEKGETFGEDETFYLRSGRVHRTDCIVNRVVYIDGSVWRGEEAPVKISAAPFDEIDEGLKALFNEQLKDSLYSTLACEYKFIPRQEQNYWICACGRANENERGSCARCGMNRTWLLQTLNVASLQSTLDARMEKARLEAEQERQEAARRQQVAQDEQDLKDAQKTLSLAQEPTTAALAPDQEPQSDDKPYLKRYTLLGVIAAALIGIGVLIYFLLK